MMRPMKLAGNQLMFGEGCLEFLKDIPTKRAIIVTGGKSMKRCGILDEVKNYLQSSGAEVDIFEGVEPDPSFATVMRGVEQMNQFKPDLIIALGGGSPMDAAKGMWVYYEYPEFKTLDDVLKANPFPKLGKKARLCCIPSTSGTASEVSRSFVLSDENGVKHGFGNMELMPNIAICDPKVTCSMPPHITAETGMDAMTHALEALVSNRANYVSDTLVRRAIVDIYNNLPIAYENGNDTKAREIMLNASMIAGMAFTNVSLGIVHSMAHTIGSIFHVSHGLADAIILPYIIRYNSKDEKAKSLYDSVAKSLNGNNMAEIIENINEKLNIAKSLKEVIPNQGDYCNKYSEMAKMALADGCTKTNPIIPSEDEMKKLFEIVYFGK